MAYRPSKRRHHSISDTDLNLTPVMNLFMVIIPFLLLTAVFAKMAIIDTYLPQEGEGGGGNQAAPPKMLIVKVMEKGKRKRCRIECLARQMDKHRGILSYGIEHYRVVKFRSHLADDVNRFRLKLF